MSANPVRHFCALFAACLLLGCGGGDSDPATTSSDTTPDPATSAPPDSTTADGNPAPAAKTTSSSGSSSSKQIDASTPDATVREALQALQDNEIERVWDLLPSSMQTEINDVFKEFGKQVDAELWDKSFNLLNRYTSTIVAKEDMVSKTPEAQAQVKQLKAMLPLLGMETNNSDVLSQEKLRELGAPMNQFVLTLLKSEFSSTQKLKSFDGREFCAKTLDPMAGHLRTFFGNLKQEASQIEELRSSPQFQVMGQMDFQKILGDIKARTESQNGDFAVVVIEYPSIQGRATGGDTNDFSMQMESREMKMNFVRVDGKWVPESLGRNGRQMIGMAKNFIPMIAMRINTQKAGIMPALAQIEPLVDALEKAKTQEEFNTAYANFNTQVPQLLASATGMPGLGAKFGGGVVKVSPVKVNLRVTGPMNDEQLGKVIAQLEALTDDPQRAITLPVEPGLEADTIGDVQQGQLVRLEITPVNDPQAFSEAISFAQEVQFNAETKSVDVSLKFEPPPQPAETPDAENSGRKR